MHIELTEGKRYYSIGELAKAFDVNASLIRFWDKEFDILKLDLNILKINNYFRLFQQLNHRVYFYKLWILNLFPFLISHFVLI